jgi:hypothetical protein
LKVVEQEMAFILQMIPSIISGGIPSCYSRIESPDQNYNLNSSVPMDLDAIMIIIRFLQIQSTFISL